ncbi:MAG: hypothetical protein U0570_10025 [Phycisphaerales bacterium]
MKLCPLAFALQGLVLFFSCLAEPAAPESRPLPHNFVAPAERNAAIRYLVAVTYLTPDMAEKLRAVDWEALGNTIDPAKLSPEFKAAAALDFSQIILWTADGTSMRRCNFESNYEAGIATLLPQLGQLRQLGRVLRVDARNQLAQGNADLAAERVAQMLALGSHVKQDGWLINVLVGTAVQQQAFEEAIAVAQSPKLGNDARARLLAAVESNQGPDPLHLQQAIVVERDSIVPWLEREAQAPGAWARLKPLLAEVGSDAEKLNLTDDEVRKQIQQLFPAYDAALVAVRSATSDEDARKYGLRVENGEWGTLAAMMLPATPKLRASEKRYREQMQRAIDALKQSK